MRRQSRGKDFEVNRMLSHGISLLDLGTVSSNPAQPATCTVPPSPPACHAKGRNSNYLRLIVWGPMTQLAMS